MLRNNYEIILAECLHFLTMCVCVWILCIDDQGRLIASFQNPGELTRSPDTDNDPFRLSSRVQWPDFLCAR